MASFFHLSRKNNATKIRFSLQNKACFCISIFEYCFQIKISILKYGFYDNYQYLNIELMQIYQ